MLGINDSSNSQRVHTANQQWCRHQQRRSEKRRAGNTTGEQGAEVDHGVGEGSGVEDLPGIDLVGPELVGGLHPRRRRRLLKRGGGGARVAAGGEGSEEAERLRLCLCLSGVRRGKQGKDRAQLWASK